MRRKDRFRAQMRLNVFDDRPRQGEAIKRRGSTPDLIQDDQALGRSRIQDDCCLRHFHHESRAAPREIIRGADACEDSIDDRKPHQLGRDERTHLRQDHE